MVSGKEVHFITGLLEPELRIKISGHAWYEKISMMLTLLYFRLSFLFLSLFFLWTKEERWCTYTCVCVWTVPACVCWDLDIMVSFAEISYLPNLQSPVENLSYSVWAAITEYHRLGSLDSRCLFLNLEVGRSECQVGWVVVRALFSAYRWLPSCCIFTWQRERLRGHLCVFIQGH